jgi:hypothetical protein
MAGSVGTSKVTAQEPGTAATSQPAQDAAQDNSAAPNIAGNWQVSWTAANGNQRQVTMRIKQNGSKLSGTFQSERGSVPLKGSLKGNQVSINVKLRRRQASFTGTVDGDKMSGTTEEGASWTATRG